MRRRDGERRRVLKTVLFTDIVGSTRLATELGDRRWRAILDRHHKVVRRHLRLTGGHEIDTAGDGFFAIFDQPTDAIECALAASGELHRLDIDIRAGIHMGEVELIGDKVSGIAVHVGARVMAQAGANEVLVSGTVRELMAGSEVRFEDRGMHELKGVSAQQHLFSVRSVVEEAEAAAIHPALVAEPEEPARRRLSTRTMVMGGLGLATVIALIASLIPAVIGGDEEASMPAGMALMDAETWDRVGFVPFGRVKTPAEAIYADGHFWVLNLDPISFVEIDPRSGRIGRSIASPFDDVGYYAVDGDTLWVTAYTEPRVAKVSISRGRVIDRFSTPGGVGTSGVAVGDGSVWVAQQEGAPLLRLDPESGHVQHSFDDIPFPNGVTYGDDAVWVTSGASKLFRIDPATNTLTSADLPLGVTTQYVAAGGGYGWNTDESKGVVYQVDSDGLLVDTFHTGEGARAVSFGDGTVWVGNQDVGTVTGIDVVTGTRRTHQFGHPLQAIAAGSGVVLIQLNPGRTYEDRIDALQGKVARLLIQPYSFEQTDPAIASGPLAFQIEYATCAPLLFYGDSEEAPPQLVPEVAAAMPEVSADGRTYTFTIRSAFRFSPPSNELVTAETFRDSIERALSPKMGPDAPGVGVVGDIRGEQAFRDGTADHISGLHADGDRLTITLERPSGSFLARISLPYFCPIPKDTPVVPGGATRKIAGPAGTSMVASAGPYYLADSFNGEYQILKRNPNYGGSRPHTLDAIALREGIDSGESIRRVQDGSWDGITNLYDGPLMPYGGLAGQQGGEDQSTYAARPLSGLDFIALNAQRPMFRNANVRRAVALVLDRVALARFFQEVSAAELLSPTLAASYPDPTIPSPDLQAARALVGRRQSRGVMASYAGCDRCRTFAETVKASLEQIGIDLTIRETPDPLADASRPGTDVDLFNGFVFQDYADAASFLRAALTEAMPASWLPPGVAQEIERIDGLDGSERTKAAVDLADRLTSEVVPAVAFGAGTTTAYLGPGLGCRVFPPYGYGLDLAALCLDGASA